MPATAPKLNPAPEPTPAPATLPAVIPVSPSPVALGTLAASTPGALVQGAAEIAGELATVIERQNLYSVIQGRRFVGVEGWTTLGAMLGVTAREVSTVEHDGGVYVSTVELVRMHDGACISRASAECGEESPWSKRPRYARRSMAQTRATGKACRLAFSWIMSLAGYEATPAEEMPPPIEAERAPVPAPVPATISASTAKALDAQIREFGLDPARVEAWISKSWGVLSLSDLSPEQFERLQPRLERWAAEEYAKAQAADDCPF